MTLSIVRWIVVPTLAAGVGIAGLAVAAGDYARLAALIAVFLLVADIATFARGRLQNLLVVASALLFGLGVIEAVAHALVPHQRFTHGEGLFGDRPEIGWGPTKPGRYPVERTQDGKTIYKAVYTIDPDLLRHVGSNPEGPTIAFFGDSFTFGDGVDDDGTLPQHFADQAHGLHVLNLAFSAYSPSQMLRELQVGLYATELRGARAFVIQTGPLHAERVACKPSFSLRAPRYVTVDGTLQYEGPCTSGLWRKIREFTAETALERAFIAPASRRLTHADIVDYLNVLAEAAKLSREKYDAPLVVIYIESVPHLLDGTGFTDDAIRGRLRADGMHVVTLDIDENLPVRIPGDGHFTSLGNRLIAEQLYRELRAARPDLLKP